MDLPTRVISLHDLCRQELRELLTQRLMPRGWDRTKDRQISKLMASVSTMLATALDSTPDALLRHPSNDVLKAKLIKAAQERLYPAMVAKMVHLFAELAQADQESLYGLGEVTDDLRELKEAKQLLETVRETLNTYSRLSCIRTPELKPTVMLLDLHTMQQALAKEERRVRTLMSQLEQATRTS